MLYQTYKRLNRSNRFVQGLSGRIQDRGFARWAAQLERAVALCPKRQRFLDIGAGDGRLTRLLASGVFEQGVAIEIMPPQESWQRLRTDCPNVQLLEGLLQELVPQLAKQPPFDFIIMAEVFEHIPPADVPAFLSALRLIIHEQSVLFFTTPNGLVQGPAEKSPIWHERQPYGHHHHYTVAEMRELLDAHGFRPVWWAFECTAPKSLLYDRLFYPVARWDYVLQHSKRLPSLVRRAYCAGSWPLVTAGSLLLQGAARAIGWYEDIAAGQHNARTMMVACVPRAQKKR